MMGRLDSGQDKLFYSFNLDNRCLVRVRHFAKRHNSETCRQLLRPQPKHDFFKCEGLPQPEATLKSHGMECQD